MKSSSRSSLSCFPEQRLRRLQAPQGVRSLGGKIAWGRGLTVLMSGLVLTAAPSAFGAVHPWAYAPLGVAVLSLSAIVLALTWPAVRSQAEGSLTLPHFPGALLVLGVMLFLLMQIAPLPPAVVRWLSPVAFDLRALGGGDGLGALMTISLNPHATWLTWLKTWPAVTFFYFLLLTMKTRRQLQALAGLMLAAALFEVFYGFWHLHDRFIWGWKNLHAGARLCGTFINSGHLAALLSMAILLGFGLFLSQEKPFPPKTSSARLRPHLAWRLEARLRRAAMLFLLSLLTLGLIATGSRGGLASLLGGFAVMGALAGSRERQGGRWPLLAFLLFAALLYSLWIGNAPVWQRFHTLGDSGRFQLWTAALAMFGDFPWTGAGLGVYGDLAYRYQTAVPGSLPAFYAHSDWLQALAETGIIGFTLLAGAWMTFYLRLVFLWRHSPPSALRDLGLGGLGALAAGALQALWDFPFHIPALTFWYAALGALTFLAVSHDAPLAGSPRPAWRPARKRGMVSILFLALLAVQLTCAWGLVRIWRAERLAPTERDSTRSPQAATIPALTQALALNPMNSQYYAGLADSWQESAGDVKAAPSLEALLQKAVRLAPARWDHRVRLADFYLKHHRLDPARYLSLALGELDAALALNPASGALHLHVGRVLAWMEGAWFGAVPPSWRGRADFHLAEAARLDPRIRNSIGASDVGP